MGMAQSINGTDGMNGTQQGGRTRRAWLAGLGSVPAGALLVACGASADQSAPSGAGAGTASKGPVALVLNGTDVEMGEMAAERLPAFEAKFPNVKVQYDNPPDYGTKLFVLAAAGSLGDVAMSYTNQGQYHFLAQ